MFEGFDPGDEPLDDEDGVPGSSEEQAVRALSEQFDTERIGGTDTGAGR